MYYSENIRNKLQHLHSLTFVFLALLLVDMIFSKKSQKVRNIYLINFNLLYLFEKY